MSIFLFSLKYFNTVTSIIGVNSRFERFFRGLKWFSYFCALALTVNLIVVIIYEDLCSNGQDCLNTERFRGLVLSILVLDVIVGGLASVFMAITLIIIRRYCSLTNEEDHKI